MMLALIPGLGTILGIVLFAFPSVIAPLVALVIPLNTSIPLPVGLALALAVAF